MNKFLKKYLIIILMVFVSITIVSCGDLSTMFGTTTINETTTIENTTTVEETTTIVETTVEVTTAAPTTIVPTTTEPITTAPDTTMTTTQIETTTTFVDNSTLVVTSPTKTTYEVYDELNLSGMIVTFIDAQSNSNELQSGDYTVDEVDMSTYGTKQVFVDYNGYQASFLIDVNLPTYFLSATDLTGVDLLLELRSLINTGFISKSYTSSGEAFETTDEDPNIPGNVIFFYSGESKSGGWNYDGTWSREHVWPKSFFVDEATGNYITYAYSDYHNLKPAHRDANSYRSNCYYANISFDDMTSYQIDKYNQYNIKKIGDTVEPRDEVKGDIARIFFYMVTMYEDLSLVDSIPNNLEMGLFSTIMEWNELDPVDDFERNRNNEIFSYQNNYNPFISYPEFIDLIWGE
ncbi:endonuclease [Candidatus Izemoplasma sp. B36]|uniref:endonuclease n=1 Tax=Candidatus Izemoplasma sp. B36 TaxID=3242468 RepID=UPI0035560604